MVEVLVKGDRTFRSVRRGDPRQNTLRTLYERTHPSALCTLLQTGAQSHRNFSQPKHPRRSCNYLSSYFADTTPAAIAHTRRGEVLGRGENTSRFRDAPQRPDASPVRNRR
jgi:hypothetical protein